MIKEHILRKLYRDKKLSMREISQIISVNERQVDYWLNKYGIKKRNISDAIYCKRNKHGDPFDLPAYIHDASILKDEKFLYGLGLGLYWGEGNKKSPTSIRLGNSDPKLIVKFIHFLNKIFKVDSTKLKYGLQIFSDIDPTVALKYWQNQLRANAKQFYKPIITISGKVGNYKTKSKYGVLTLYFNNVKLKKIIFEKVQQL